MELAERIADIVRPTIAAMGYALVRVQVAGRLRPAVQIMAERENGRPMQLDDCAELSRALSAVLDVEDPVHGPYTLEVSSPGIDRPLVQLNDYRRFAGFEARVETSRPVNGRKRFRGRVLGASDDQVRLAVDDGEVALLFADIQRGKLVLTDDLLAAHARAEAGERVAGDEQSPD